VDPLDRRSVLVQRTIAGKVLLDRLRKVTSTAGNAAAARKAA
jgi:hypothetical protein